MPARLRGILADVIDHDTGYYFMPVSLKAVVLDEGGILLCHNSRDEWELPGGWPAREDEQAADTIRREVHEETGLDVAVQSVLHADILRVAHDTRSFIVMYSATCLPAGDLRNSTEHDSVRFFSSREIPQNLPALYRRGITLALARTGDGG